MKFECTTCGAKMEIKKIVCEGNIEVIVPNYCPMCSEMTLKRINKK